MIDEGQGIDDRIFWDPIYKVKEEVEENRLYYIFNKGKEYIAVSGVGDPDNLKDMQWNSSEGAKGILKQILRIDSGYSPKLGFVKFSDHPNNIYIQISRFGSIYKDGWRFNRNNIGDELRKIQGKVRVHVKASKRSKAHYRMQNVGTEDIELGNSIWEITKSNFKELLSADKNLLKERYIKEHAYSYYDNHPKLEYLVSIMNDRMQDRTDPTLNYFDGNYSNHEAAVIEALDNDIPVPLYVMKDYEDLAYSYDIDISEEALKNTPIESKVLTDLYEMSKDRYDKIIAEVKADCNDDPKKVTDTMLNNKGYTEKLSQIKKAVKLRKKIFKNLPEMFQEGYTADTMDMALHKSVMMHRALTKEKVSTSVQSDYPTLFDVEFNYKSTGNEKIDKSINEVLTKAKDIIGDNLSTNKMDEIIEKIIKPSKANIFIDYSGISKENMILIDSGMNDISQRLNGDLVKRLNNSDTKVKFKYEENRTRASGGEVITLGRNAIDPIKMQYNKNVIFHEYGHSIEAILSEISKASNDFLNTRTEKGSSVKLGDIEPGLGYGDSEFTKVDNFMSPYVGKQYGNRPYPDIRYTEILSMGMGYFSNNVHMMYVYDTDPEYFGFILAVMSGKIKNEDE